MAFRSFATAFSNSGSVTLTATPAGVVANDRLLGFFVQDSTGHTSAKPTGGWVDVSLQTQATPDSQTFHLYEKTTASGSDSFATGIVVDAAACQWKTMAFSGRDNAAAIVFNTAQKNTSTASPITISTANATSGTVGVTAGAGDDAIMLAQLDKITINDVWGFNNDLTGYTEQSDTDNDWVTACIYTKDNVSGGGEGTLSFTSTRSAGTTGSGWGTFVVALKVAAGGGTFDDRFRFRSSSMISGSGSKLSAWPDNAIDSGRRDSIADNFTRTF